MPRALWKGSISFGLVEIPVSLHTARRRSEEISFTQLDKRDLSPIGYERVNKKTGQKVPWGEIVKGFEHEPGQFVVLTEADVAKANVEASRTIEIVDFVDGSEIESVFYDEPYYVAPLKKASKSYALLRETIRKTGKVAIAKVVVRTRQHIAAVTVRGPALVVNTLRYAYEVADPDDLELPAEGKAAPKVTPAEIAMAERLVESMTTEWEPAKYKDEYRDDVLAMVERKVKAGGSRVVEEPAEKKPKKRPEVLDLMPLLKQSVARTKKGAAAEEEPAPAAPAKKRKRA
jgi:DNA end-binding protein Ku